jgi:hypothetical protein
MAAVQRFNLHDGALAAATAGTEATIQNANGQVPLTDAAAQREHPATIYVATC